MNVIRTKRDASAFSKRFKAGDAFYFPDSRISIIGGGNTRISFDGVTFYQYSFGANWQDQQKEPIADIVSFVWKHRRDIKKGEFA